jgi:hypothetical protein
MCPGSHDEASRFGSSASRRCSAPYFRQEPCHLDVSLLVDVGELGCVPAQHRGCFAADFQPLQPVVAVIIVVALVIVAVVKLRSRSG